MRTFTVLTVLAALSLGALSGCSSDATDDASSADEIKGDKKLHPNQVKAIEKNLSDFAELNGDKVKIKELTLEHVGEGGYSNIVRVKVGHGSKDESYLVATMDQHFDADMYGDWKFTVDSLSLESEAVSLADDDNKTASQAPSKECAALAEKAAFLNFKGELTSYKLAKTELARMDKNKEIIRVTLAPNVVDPDLADETESYLVSTEKKDGKCRFYGKQLKDAAALTVKSGS